MKLNKKSKKELRKLIKKELKNVPNGNRIHLEKGLLEQLLFNEYEGIRLPLWSGEFLSKIDLSEISFEDVSWGFLAEENYEIDYEEFLSGEEKFDKIMSQNKQKTYIINYTNTNANIDFTKSWEYKNYEEIIISNINFSGTDLSKNDMSSISECWNSNLSNTGIIIPKNSNKIMFFESTNLEGIDLSTYEINATDYIRDCAKHFVNCNLKNTGIKIIDKATKDLQDYNYEYKNYKLSESQIFEFHEDIRQGKYDGCYINGKLINSNYAHLKNDLVENIREQITKIKKL